MYYLSPFTYLVEGMLVTGLGRASVVCSEIEFNLFDPPSNLTRSQYLESYLRGGGYLREDTINATQGCAFCSASQTDTVLAGLSTHYSNRWRDFGIMWAFVGFNVCAAIFLYWLARVPKKQKVLDVPPAEGASRVSSRVSRVQSSVSKVQSRTTSSERKTTILEEKSTSLEEKATTLEDKTIGSEAEATSSEKRNEM